MFKSFRVLERIKANTISTLVKEISEEDIQNLLNLCTPCIFVYRNPHISYRNFMNKLLLKQLSLSWKRNLRP